MRRAHDPARQGRRSRQRWSFALAVAAAALTACTSATAQARREERLRAALDLHRYAQPLSAVWPEARRTLFDRGVQLVGRDRAAVGAPPASALRRLTAGGFETARAGPDALALESMEDGSRTRYRLEGVGAAGDGCRIVVTAIRRTGSAPSEERTRALDLELELVRRLDPDAAARIARALDGP